MAGEWCKNPKNLRSCKFKVTWIKASLTRESCEEIWNNPFKFYGSLQRKMRHSKNSFKTFSPSLSLPPPNTTKMMAWYKDELKWESSKHRVSQESWRQESRKVQQTIRPERIPWNPTRIVEESKRILSISSCISSSHDDLQNTRTNPAGIVKEKKTKTK